MIKAVYENHMGDDLTIVNAARVSFGKRSQWVEIEGPVQTEVDYDSRSIIEYREKTYVLKEADKRLIHFLARGCESKEWDALVEQMFRGVGVSDRFTESREEAEALVKYIKDQPTHWTPFGHTAITLVEQCPIPIARQRFKHATGTVYNEISRRYVEDGIEFYWPDEWRSKAEDKKQGSGDPLPEEVQVEIDLLYAETVGLALENHEKALKLGLCPEQARFFIPQGMMTQYWVTGNLYCFAQAYKKRIRPDAQYEIRLLAQDWDRIIRPLFPQAWSALVD